MIETLQAFLSGNYEPHGYCLLWQPALIWTHIVSDTLIALSYFSIPVALIYFVRRRPDVDFGWMLGLFALFILACGTTHVLGVWNLWHGDYGIEAIVKAITAAASVPTAILLWRLIPVALGIPAPAELQLANSQLVASINERDQALDRLKQEIASREKAEAALLQAQKMDAVGQLTGGIAHDFNNMLQAISGNLDLIHSNPGDHRIDRWAETAGQAVARGTRLTGQLLAFSRTQRLQLRSVDLNTLIRSMGDLLFSSAGALVGWTLELDPEIGFVRADEAQLELAILNLTINARDAMPEGGDLLLKTRRVEIDEPRPGLMPGSYVELSITDTGIGMPADVLARALEPFYTTKELGRGTGLGLSMAFGVATQSGGTLELESKVEAGTTVRILLPRDERAAEEAVQSLAAPDAAVAEGAVKGLCAAVVDDEPDVRRFVAEALELIGFECHAFDGGASFLADIDRLRPAVLFLDYAMPGMTGAEVARALKARHGSPRIVFMTGYADSAALDEVVDENVRVLRKPFSAAALRDAGLAQALSRPHPVAANGV